MRTGAAALVALAGSFASACGTGETGRPPPIGGTRGSDPGVIGGDVDGGFDDGGGMGGATGVATTGLDPTTTLGTATLGTATFGTATFGTATFGTATFGTGLGTSILSGSILTDASLFPLPMNCGLRLHEPGAVDPGTGLSSGPIIDVPVVLDEPQQRFDIGLDEVQEVVNQGDLVYVEVRCDVDGDGSFDTVGGWYPLLPAEIVELPAEDIDLVIDDLPA